MMDPRQRLTQQQQQQLQAQSQARPPPPQPPHIFAPQPDALPTLRSSLPVDAEPTFEDLRNMTTIDMAIARYRAKHGHMNEIFDPRSVASIEASSKSVVKPVDLATLEAQAKQLEQANLELEHQTVQRLASAKERFEAISRGETVSPEQDVNSDGEKDAEKKVDVDMVQVETWPSFEGRRA